MEAMTCEWCGVSGQTVLWPVRVGRDVAWVCHICQVCAVKPCPEAPGNEQGVEGVTAHTVMIAETGQCPWCGSTDPLP